MTSFSIDSGRAVGNCTDCHCDAIYRLGYWPMRWVCQRNYMSVLDNCCFSCAKVKVFQEITS